MGASEVTAFWSWFARSSETLRRIKTGSEDQAAELTARLEALDPDLTWEVGPDRGSGRELVISASGIKRAFPMVLELVSGAPQIDGWNIVAFRQREAPYRVEFGGTIVDPEEVWFEADWNGRTVDLTLHIRGHDVQQVSLQQAIYIMLDGVLGEYDVETKIGAIDWRAARSVPRGGRVRPIAELATVVDGLTPLSRH